MADNFTATEGVGITIAADEISSVKYPRVKVCHGADGSSTDASAASPLPVGGGVAHDAADAGSPVKVGGRARTSLPAAVANDDRADFVTDSRGRLLTAGYPPEAQVNKSGSYTTAQAPATLWANGASERFCVDSLHVNVAGATGGDVTVWFGLAAETVPTPGTDPYIFEGTFAPAATGPQTVVLKGPFYGLVDEEVHVTTSAGITLKVQLFGHKY